MPVYARINVPWNFGEGWVIDDESLGANIIAGGPPPEGDPYYINLWDYFFADDQNQPYSAGEVVVINGDQSHLPIADPTVIFTKP